MARPYDVGFGSSRMNHMQQAVSLFHPNRNLVAFEHRGGWKLDSIRQHVIGVLDSGHDVSNTHVYIMAGLCDITQMDRFVWGQRNYEEVCFIEEPNEKINIIKNKFDLLEASILIRGATPIFATIIPASIKAWNYTRLEQGRTPFLLHHDQYEDMESLVNDIISDLNFFLINKNVNNGVATPHVADQFITHRNGHRRIHFNRLADGVHPNEEYSAKTGIALWKAVKKNRNY